MCVYKINDNYTNDNQKIYKGHYMESVIKNLVKFINNKIKATEITKFSKDNNFIIYGKAKKLSLADNNI